MIIKNISIKNFKLFNDNENKNSFDFSVKKDKPLVIVVGGNGIGKSTVWEAINWVFFGRSLIDDRINDSKKKGDEWTLVTSETPGYISAMKSNEKSFEVKVSATIELDLTEFDNIRGDVDSFDSMEFNLTRISRIGFKTNSDGVPLWKYLESQDNVHGYNDKLEINQITKKGNIPIKASSDNQKEFFIRTFAPYGIRKYYFFDAANDDITSISSDSNRVGEAVRQLSGINKAFDFCKMVEKYIGEVKLKKTDSQFNEKKKQYEDNIAHAKREKSKIQPRLTDFPEKKRILEDEISALNQKVGNATKKKDLFSELKNLKTHIKGNEKLKKTLQESHNSVFKNYYPFAILKDKMDVLNKKIIEDLDKGIFPEGLAQTDIDTFKKILVREDLIKKISVKIGLDLKISEKFINNLFESIKKEIKKTDERKGLEVGEIPRQLENLIKGMNDDKSALDDYDSRIIDAVSEIENSALRITEIYNELKTDEDNAESLEKDIDLLALRESQLTTLKMQNERDKKDWDRWNSHQQVNQGLLDKLLEGNRGRDLEQYRVSQLNNLKTYIKDRISPFEETNRINVKENMNSFIDSVFKDEKLWDSISIDSKYSLKTNDGVNVGSLSRGQKLSVAISFILALIKTSGANPPLLVDAPAAHLDDKRGLKLYNCYKENSLQTIFFVMPGREIGAQKDETDYLLKHSNHVFTLKRSDKGESKHIEISKGFKKVY